MQTAAISVRCNGPMGDEKEMKIYSFGEETKPAILLLPGTCCHWKRNFGHVIPLLQEHFYVLCASYDGFDETEDSTFPNMLIETAKLESYIQKNLGGQLFAAYGCSLGGSFVGLMVQRKKIHIRHGILGSSDLDQGSSFGTWAMAKAMTPLLGKMLRSGKLPVWAKKKMEEKAGAEYAQAMLQLFGCSAATQELPSMAFVSNTSIFNQFFSDMVTPLEDDIYVPGTKIHCFYAVKMGEEYENRYRRHFVDPDIRYHAMQHEELLACYPEQWVEEVLASCRLDGRGMEENDFEERHFTEAERAQAEITESGNPRKPEGEDGKKMLERMNESHHNVTGWALSLWEIQGNDNILDIGCGGGAALSRMAEHVTDGHLTGIDYSPVSVETSRATNTESVVAGKMEILEGSVEKLPFEAETFDKIVTVESFYFWPNPQENLKEVRRVLKTGGTFLLVADIYEKPGLPREVKDNIRKFHLFNPTREQFKNLFREAGFAETKIHTKDGEDWICVEGTK